MNSTNFNEPFSISLLINLITILSSCIGIIFSVIFIFLILYNRSLHTISNLLTLNSTLAIFILSSDTLSIAIYVLYRDIKREKLQISIEMKSIFLCHIRGYIAHISFGALVYSYVIQACYRLIGIIYYHRKYFNHIRIYGYLICIQWIFSTLQILPIILGNNQIYIKYEYLCQIAIENSKGICYVNITNYIIPVSIIIIIYYKIRKSVRKKTNNGSFKYNVHRARRQMVLTQRILILIAIIFVLGGPYSVFIIIEALSLGRAPSYSHRIGFMFISIACTLSILTIIRFTHSVREMIAESFNFKKKSLRKEELLHLNSIQLMKITRREANRNTTDDT